MIDAADLVLGPLGIGDHVDHSLVPDVLVTLRPDALLWEDWPYADRKGKCVGPPALRVSLEDGRAEAKVTACACYHSQLGFQFGSAEAMTARLSAKNEERFYRAA